MNYFLRISLLLIASMVGYALSYVTTTMTLDAKQNNQGKILGACNSNTINNTSINNNQNTEVDYSQIVKEYFKSETKIDNTSNFDHNDQLRAWWTTMEYNEKLIATIYAEKLIGCEFLLTFVGNKKAIVKKSYPVITDSCSFEIDTKGEPYKIWGKATSLDGEVQEFGIY